MGLVCRWRLSLNLNSNTLSHSHAHTRALIHTHTRARTHIPSQLLIMQPCLSPSPCDTPKCDSIVLVERKARDGQRRVPACFGACVCVCVSLSGLCSFNCAPLYIQMSAASVVRVTLSSGNNVNSTNQTFNLFLLCGTVLLKEKKRFFMLLQN